MKTIQQYATCGAIPPHMLEHVATHGDDAARATMASTLRHSTLIAEQRGVAAASVGKEGGGKRREVYDAEHGRELPGRLVMNERKSTSRDRQAAEAFGGAGVTWDFYRKLFGRDSIDGKGMSLVSTVHFGDDFDNAMWDGRQMIYGDGDRLFFNRFTAALDVIGHELTHGVTQHSAGLEYKGESGALNEHFSDAFGIMVKQYALGQTAGQSSWILGQGLFTPRVSGKGIRSMKAPGSAYDDPVLGRDPQPAHMRDYVRTTDDNGGVHINSGIPNHAFYLAATEIGGMSWSILGRIWYEVLTERLSAGARFADAARETTAVAGAIFGAGSQVQRIIAAAWAAVGVPTRPATHARLPVKRSSAAAPKWRTRPAAATPRKEVAS